MKHLMNLINVAIEIIIHLYLQHRLHQITLIEVHLPVYHLLLIHIRVMAPGMVVLIIIIINIMDTILVLETIVGETTIIIIIIKVDHHHHSCLLIFLHVLLHLWVRVKTIVIVIATEIDITEEMGGTITEDKTLLVVVGTGGDEIRYL